MHSKSHAVSLALAFAAIVGTATISVAAEQWLGTWKLNLGKSKYSPPELAPKAQTAVWEARGDGMTLVVDGVDASGKPIHQEYSVKYDGKDYPWVGQANADTIALTRVDDEYFETTWKLKGQVTFTGQTVVSRDGKTLTANQYGTDAQGRAVATMSVYDRQ
jgi:hypothetical protein